MEHFDNLPAVIDEQELVPISVDAHLIDLPNTIPSLEEIAIGSNLKPIVAKFLQQLAPREERVLRMIYGIGCKEATHAQIAAEFNVTRERIRQIESNAMRKFRHRLPSKDPSDYFCDFDVNPVPIPDCYSADYQRFALRKPSAVLISKIENRHAEQLINSNPQLSAEIQTFGLQKLSPAERLRALPAARAKWETERPARERAAREERDRIWALKLQQEQEHREAVLKATQELHENRKKKDLADKEEFQSVISTIKRAAAQCPQININVGRPPVQLVGDPVNTYGIYAWMPNQSQPTHPNVLGRRYRSAAFIAESIQTLAADLIRIANPGCCPHAIPGSGRAS